MAEIRYVIPGPLRIRREGQRELERRSKILQGWARPGTSVQAVDIARGPASMESAYEGYLAFPALAEAVLAAERDEVEAVIVGCFDDPGVDGLREVCSKTMVLGPAGTTMHVACMLGEQIGIVTVPNVEAMRRSFRANRLDTFIAGIDTIDSAVMALGEDVAKTRDMVVSTGERLVERGADVLVLGCMSLGFLELEDELSRALGVPVLNPARTALAQTEMLIDTGLAVSKLAYPTPPKLLNGVEVDELVVE